MRGGSKHTLRIDQAGNVWSSGDPLSRFDPESHKFPRFLGDFRHLQPRAGSGREFLVHHALRGSNREKSIGKHEDIEVEGATSKSYPRRIEVDTDGNVWFGEFDAGKIVRFDPKSETFKEYPLAGPEPTPTASPLMRIITFGTLLSLDTLGDWTPRPAR